MPASGSGTAYMKNNKTENSVAQLQQFPDTATHVNSKSSKRSIQLHTEMGSNVGVGDIKVSSSVKQQPIGSPHLTDDATFLNSGGGQIEQHNGRTAIKLDEMPMSVKTSYGRCEPGSQSKIEYGSQLGISRIRKNVNGSVSQVYYKIRPQQNEILDILQSLERFETNALDVSN